MVQDFISNIETTWLLLAVVALVSGIWLWTKIRRPYTKYNIPPFPVKPWPIFGHIFQLNGDLRETFKEWRKKAGDIYSVDIAGRHVIFLNGFDAIKDVVVKHADNIPNVEENIANSILNEYNTGIVGGKDENWKEQRTTSIAILRSFGVGKNIMAENIQEEVTTFLEKLSSFNGKSNDIRVLTNVSVSNVICSIIVGKRFEYDDPYFVQFMVRLNNILQYLPALQLVAAFPILSYFPGDLFHVKKWTRSTLETNESFSKAYINKFKKTFNGDEEPENFITAYLQEMKKKEDKGEATRLNEDNLIAIIRTLFIAGTETTSTTILWCLIYMLHHPDVQEKVYQEIEANVGTERVPNVSDKPNLKYLNAVIMETQRKASLVPGSFRREIKKSFQLRGFDFPKDSVVWPILDSVHFDKEIWGDPHNFRPERFLDKSGSLIHPEELIPFSIGRRACLGESLAKMELFLFLSAMFQRFRFEPDNTTKELPSLQGVFGATVVPKPFKMRFTERRR